MSSRPIQMYSGVESIRGAEQLLRAQQDRHEQWPYPHVYPPVNSEDVLVIGSLAIPGQLADGFGVFQVLSYKVNSGKRFFLQAVLLGANVSIVPGQAFFTVVRNFPLSSPQPVNTQSMGEHGLINVPCQLGSNLSRPWYLQRAREFAALDVVSIIAQNVGLPVGDPNYYICGLFGFEIPSVDVKSTR